MATSGRSPLSPLARTCSSVMPARGSIAILMIFSGYFSARSSMDVPPSLQPAGPSATGHRHRNVVRLQAQLSGLGPQDKGHSAALSPSTGARAAGSAATAGLASSPHSQGLRLQASPPPPCPARHPSPRMPARAPNPALHATPASHALRAFPARSQSAGPGLGGIGASARSHCAEGGAHRSSWAQRSCGPAGLRSTSPAPAASFAPPAACSRACPRGPSVRGVARTRGQAAGGGSFDVRTGGLRRATFARA
jgi:hypothetical protein